ncbi:MAG: sigma-70 family RNA polymerase sigma factor [Lachnospiraceae bacterium]|jgi:RNA polymerase sigma-70 factor (ECF subfamily)|nr:sigma-70 family RNA polymerase sigma factor [Lachnospiraceae bacterium]
MKVGESLLDDKQIYSLLIENPEKGLEKLMGKYMGFVYAIVNGKLNVCCHKQDIEECVSDIFYEAYQTRDRMNLAKGSLKSYLAVLAKRRAIDVFRKLRKSSDIVSLDESLHDFMADEIDIEKDAIEGETRNRIIGEIQKLGEPDNQILIRKYYFDQSAKRIAKDLGMRENTVNKRVSRALGKLKLSLGGIL